MRKIVLGVLTAGILATGAMAEDLCQNINIQTRDALGETHTSGFPKIQVKIQEARTSDELANILAAETLAFGDQIKKEEEADKRDGYGYIRQRAGIRGLLEARGLNGIQRTFDIQVGNTSAAQGKMNKKVTVSLQMLSMKMDLFLSVGEKRVALIFAYLATTHERQDLITIQRYNCSSLEKFDIDGMSIETINLLLTEQKEYDTRLMLTLLNGNDNDIIDYILKIPKAKEFYNLIVKKEAAVARKAQEEAVARKAQEEAVARKAQEEAVARKAQEEAQEQVGVRAELENLRTLALYSPYSPNGTEIAPDSCLDIIGDPSQAERTGVTNYNGIAYVLYMKRNGAFLYGDDRVIVGAAQVTSCFTAQEWKVYHNVQLLDKNIDRQNAFRKQFFKNHPRWKVKSNLSIEALQKPDFGKNEGLYIDSMPPTHDYNPFNKKIFKKANDVFDIYFNGKIFKKDAGADAKLLIY